MSQAALAAQDALLIVLLEAIDEPVGGDRGHVFRVQRYSRLLAEQLRADSVYHRQIDRDFLDDLHRFSPLHDLGKMGIDPQILNKPGRLTPAEFEIVKQHVQIGLRLLTRAGEISEDSRFLTMARDIVQYHHERYDGAGYCSGLKGTEIPLAARIVALADVYDALTSRRAYKQAYDPERAKAEIEAESGRHFDPVIVEAFRARYPDFIAAAAPGKPSLFVTVDQPPRA